VPNGTVKDAMLNIYHPRPLYIAAISMVAEIGGRALIPIMPQRFVMDAIKGWARNQMSMSNSLKNDWVKKDFQI